MSTNQTGAQKIGRNVGAELPFRRSTLDRRTGSLVFDRHLDDTLSQGLPASDGRRRS